MKKNIWIPTIIIIIVVLLDQWTKYMVKTTMTIGERITVIPGFFTVTSHRNEGAAWGILDGNMTFFYFITIFAIGLFLYLLKDMDFKDKPFYSIGITLMFAGAIGNFIDRLAFQQVTDFIDVDLWSYTTFPTFNIADSSLVIGVIAFAIDILLEDVIKWKHTKSK
jgi:signal peptidase II